MPRGKGAKAPNAFSTKRKCAPAEAKGLRRERAELPCLSCVPWFEDGGPLLATMDGLGLEGVVPKRYDAPYRSGRRKEWIKVKFQSWLEANRERWKAFDRR